MAFTLPELEAAASDVIQILNEILEFASRKVAVIGGLALWKHMPNGRRTEDVDFIMNIDTAPKSVKPKLLALSNSRFFEVAQYFYYKAENGKSIQVDILPDFESSYFPEAATVVNAIPRGYVPYISAVDLIVFKIHCCGYRALDSKKLQDATDAAQLLRQETLLGPLRLTPVQAHSVKDGLPDVLAISQFDERWWLERLGI